MTTGLPGTGPLPDAVHVQQVEDHVHGFSFDRAEARATGIFDVALRVSRVADADGVSPAVAADRLARSAQRRSAGRPPSGCRAERTRSGDSRGRPVPVADPCRKLGRDRDTQSGSPRGPSSPELGSRTP